MDAKAIALRKEEDRLRREIFAAVSRISRQPYHLKRLRMILSALEMAEGYKQRCPATGVGLNY